MEITAKQVKELRDKTGAAMMDCKKALVETKGDEERAIVLLRKKGQATAEKRQARATSEGIIGAYVHGGKIGVLVEVGCETDFVARNELFTELVNDLCLQVAAMNPLAVNREDIPEEVLAREKEIYGGDESLKNKPPQVVEKIIEGKINKFFQENVLLEQAYIKDSKMTVMDRVNELIGKTGENVQVKRFVRFAMGS